MKNYQNKFVYLIVFINLIFFSQLPFAFAKVNTDKKNVYIMLDVDGTITARVDPNDTDTITHLEEEGFHCYRLKFLASKFGHAKFYSWYTNMLKDEKLREEQKLNIRVIDGNTLEIEEVVVVLRPAIQKFLEKLDCLNNSSLSIKFYIASRNDDVRSQNLINHLNATINGVPFKDKVKLIPRADFRIHLYSAEEGLIAGKSAALVREKLHNEKGAKIEKGAYIIFIDNIASERFVIGDRELDKLLRPTRFTISNLNETDIEKDCLDFQSMLKTIIALVE